MERSLLTTIQILFLTILIGGVAASAEDIEFVGSAGVHSVTWDARDRSSGVYFHRVAAGPDVAMRNRLPPATPICYR